MKTLTRTNAPRLQEHHTAMGRESATERSGHDTRPYVVRDLSWEFARFLDTEDFAASAFAAPDSSNGSSTQTK